MNRIGNILFLSIDALRADHLLRPSFHRNTARFLGGLASSHITYTSAFSPSCHTREAVPSLITGQYPDSFAKHGYRLTRKSIAERLSEQFYSTAAFHSNPYISPAYGYGSGFNIFDDDLLLSKNRFLALAQRAIDKFLLNRGQYHARAEEINEKSLDWIDSVDEPFFLWNHYMDVHGPYNPPDGYLEFTDTRLSNNAAQQLYQKSIDSPEEITEDERQLLIDLYDCEIYYLDAQLERFYNELQDRNLLENTLVIITADHGDAFGEWGYYTHPRYLHEPLIHVPLIIAHPNAEGDTIDSLVSLLDLVPTMLEWAGLDSSDLPGEPLLDADGTPRHIDRDVVFAGAHSDEDPDIRWFVARGHDWKVQYECDVTDGTLVEETVFRIAETEEEIPDPPDDPAITQLREALDEHCRERLADADFAPMEDDSAEPREIEERLEALGYK